MEFTTEFELDLPPDDAYALLLDLRRVAPCFPGATLGEEGDDGSYAVSVAVKLGALRLAYGGDVRIEERDDDARRAVLVGAARERRGQGSARARIELTVTAGGEGPSGSRVVAASDVQLTGRAAQIGGGIVQGVAEQMVADMAACLAAQASAPQPDAAQPSGAQAPRPAPPTRSALGTLLRGLLRSLRARLRRR